MSVELAQIVSLTAQIEATDHVGRSNRLGTQRERVFRAIDAAPERVTILRALLAHPQPSVRMVAAWHCGWRQFLPEDAERAASELAQRGGAVGREAQQWLDSRERMAGNRPPPPPPPPAKTLSYDPLPAACSLEAAQAMIARSASKTLARKLAALLRPAIRLWPRAHRNDPRASGFGGLPVLPPDYVWPSHKDEPLLFLGQIDCGEVHAAIGPNPLPEQGLLQFYGDHDEVVGCGPYGSSAVLYFPDSRALQPAPAPVPDFLELPRCGLDFFVTAELPDPLSDVIANLRLSGAMTEAYSKLRNELAVPGGGGKRFGYASRLLGWPDLIQRDLGEFCNMPEAGRSLLLQIGWYHDGATYQDWGPGGIVYFFLDSAQFEAGRFDLAEMEMQCT